MFFVAATKSGNRAASSVNAWENCLKDQHTSLLRGTLRLKEQVDAVNSHLHQQILAEIFSDLATSVRFGRQGDELPGVLQKLIPELNADAGLGTVSRYPLRVGADGADGADGVLQAPTWSSSSKASAKERSQAASAFWR